MSNPRLVEEQVLNKAVNITAVNKIKLVGNLFSIHKEQLWNVLADRKRVLLMCAREDVYHICRHVYA